MQLIDCGRASRRRKGFKLDLSECGENIFKRLTASFRSVLTKRLKEVIVDFFAFLLISANELYRVINAEDHHYFFGSAT